MFRKSLTLAFITTFAVSCMADNKPFVEPPPTNPTPPVDMPTDTVVASSKARVRFKGGDRYTAALASALELEPNQVCVELGLYSCDDVHRITMGGVSPYEDGIIVALDGTVSTTPIAVDRIALAACSQRAELDFDDLAQATVFAGLELADGAVIDIEAASVERTIQELVRRLLTRDASDDEVAALRALYGEMAEVGSPDLAQAWGAASCFAVATTMEALFY